MDLTKSCFNKNLLDYKVYEYRSWYSADANILSNFYSTYNDYDMYKFVNNRAKNYFWQRSYYNKQEVSIHVPIAADICAMSANLLFSETPMISLASEDSIDSSNNMALNNILVNNGFYKIITRAAEECAALGGVFIKLAWDKELSPYPILEIEQIYNSIPVFRHGILVEVIFVKIVNENAINNDNTHQDVYRLLEIYRKDGSIQYKLYKGTRDKLGDQIDTNYLTETSYYADIYTNYNDILATYIPNILPNRLDLTAWQGRSDLAGLEGIFNSIDEIYSAWIRDIMVAQAKLIVPDSFIQKTTNYKYNVDSLVYVSMEYDPLMAENVSPITSVQFAIRAEEFLKTSLEYVKNAITLAGYSVQNFGMGLNDKAESGTALSIKQNKSILTRSKKESNWEMALYKIVKDIIFVNNYMLGGDIIEGDVNITFSNAVSNSLSEVSDALQKISIAAAASTETKVKMLNPELSQDAVDEEVRKILAENNLTPIDDMEDIGKIGYNIPDNNIKEENKVGDADETEETEETEEIDVEND